MSRYNILEGDKGTMTTSWIIIGDDKWHRVEHIKYIHNGVEYTTSCGSVNTKPAREEYELHDDDEDICNDCIIDEVKEL